jgi:hypothetical protein
MKRIASQISLAIDAKKKTLNFRRFAESDFREQSVRRIHVVVQKRVAFRLYSPLPKA